MIISSEKAKFTDARVDYRGRLHFTFKVGKKRFLTAVLAEPECIISVEYADSRDINARPFRVGQSSSFSAKVVTDPIVSTSRPKPRKRGRKRAGRRK